MILDATTLAAAVRTVLPATRTNHLPVLKGVRLACDDPFCLTVTATDLDLSIQASIETGDVLEPCVVPAALLGGWLEGREGEIELRVDGPDLLVVSETGHVALRTMPVEDWPRVEVSTGDPVALDRRMAGILYAASRDGARPILNGVGCGDGWACCTDSYQLSAVKLDGLPEAIVPVRLLELALKTEGTAFIAVDDRRVTVAVAGVVYTGRLIEGRFPSWRNLVGEPKQTVTIERDAAVAALERTLVLCDAETPVRITPTGEGLRFTVVSRDVGEIVEHVAGGEDLGGEYGFRPRLLLNLLRSREEAKVDLGVTDMLHPVSVRDETSVALVMPVRLS